MPNDDKTRFEIFISSRMREFADERKMLFDLIPSLSTDVVDLKAWVYEINAPASDHTIRDNYLKTLIDSELYIAILGQGYGEWTVDEFNIATRESIPRHVYVLVMDDEERDDKQSAFIRQIQGVEFGIAPRYFTNIDDLRRAVADSIQVWLRERLMHRAGSTTATFADRPLMVENLPGKLIGREHLTARINPLLDTGESVLLRGFGGMGKTALAATVAKERIESGKGAVLWQKLGSENSDAVFQALARPFNGHQAVAAAQSDDEKRSIVRQLVIGAGVTLVVLDDAWDGKTLMSVLRAVPNGVPVLVTSRHRYGLRQIIEVGELAPDKAIETLGYYANTDYRNDRGAMALCQHLGYHAFALEVAGQTIRADSLTPSELLNRVENAPERMKVPDEFAEEGRATVADLITASLTMLDNETQRVFMAMGAFFAKRMTPEMLALYFTDVPIVTDDMIANARVQIPDIAHAEDAEIRTGLQQVIANKINPPILQVENALQVLARRGLVEQEPATDRSAPAIRIHDLAYAYARSRHTDESLHRALDTCIMYTWRYNQPSLSNFAALSPELDNFIGAASWAMIAGRLMEIERFAWNLYAQGSEVLDYVGFYAQAITLLELAAQAAKKRGRLRDHETHLNNLGLCFQNVGQYQKAIDTYNEAMPIARQVGDRQGEANALGNLGNAYFNLGQTEKAIQFLEQSLGIQREINDLRGQGNQLGNLGNAYHSLGQYEKAIEYHQQALEISRQTQNRRGEGQDLSNLGIAYHGLDETEKAISHHRQALAIAREIGDRRSEGSILGNLGIGYRKLGQYDQAVAYYQQAIAIRRDIGDRMGQANDLNNIGVLYETQGNHTLALDYFRQAQQLYLELGVMHEVKNVESNIGIVERRIKEADNGGDSNPPATSPLPLPQSEEASLAHALATAYQQGGDQAVRQLLVDMGASEDVIQSAIAQLRQLLGK